MLLASMQKRGFTPIWSDVSFSFCIHFLLVENLKGANLRGAELNGANWLIRTYVVRIMPVDHKLSTSRTNFIER